MDDHRNCHHGYHKGMCRLRGREPIVVVVGVFRVVVVISVLDIAVVADV